MTSLIGTYSFLPWLRQGLANQISGAFDGPRATMEVRLQLRGTKLDGTGDDTDDLQRPVALFGPGDIQGIEQRAIIRTEPRDWSLNFEPNYVPAIEFYDEDLPWRYTPEPPDLAKGRLRPWIMLVVLAEGEFTEGTNLRDKPLPYVDVASLDAFPDFAQLWACAHVHVNRRLVASNPIVSNDMTVVIPQLQTLLAQNADLGYSRIVSPRMLAEKTAYHAFLMPVFESGRRAGLGLDPSTAGVTDSAWGTQAREQGSSFPYYFRWHFRTSTAGDFESLVRLLQPKPVDRRVGTREMDVQRPGINIRGLDDAGLRGVLKLGGALRVPRASFVGDELTQLLKYENWAHDFPRPIQEDLAKRINLADDYEQRPAAAVNAAAGITDPENAARPDPDPVITLPLYGRWHALTKRLRAEAAQPYNWLHELNLDPRFRVAAGFGTRVVQEQQEKYMDAAWEQIGKVLEANRRIRLGHLAREVSFIWYDRHLKPLVAADREKGMMLLAPLNKRVVAGGVTVHQQFAESFVQPTMTSGVMRRVVRPRGRLVQGLPAEGSNTKPASGIIGRVNDGAVNAAPPKVTPPALVTPNQIGDEIRTRDLPGFLNTLMRLFPNNRFRRIVLALLALLLRGRRGDAIRAADGLREEGRTPAAVDRLPKSPDFTITTIDSGFTPTRGSRDSAEAVKFKDALKGAYALIEESVKSGAIPPKKKLDLSSIVATTVATIDPAVTVPKRVLGGIFLPPRVREEIGEQFVEAMAYPVIDQPMYEPLKDVSSELFLPNINLIEANSITLLETNQKFIEAYMVGLNHEFARELLWREYPTDQRGSYFRQFWDVKSFFNAASMTDEALKESLRDIPPIHRWSRASKLEDHDNRETGAAEEEIVVVIRGELLKRYPTAVIYAHRAVWQLKSDGTLDNTKERRPIELTAAEEASPPRDKVRTPLYDAKVDPDIYFFGFDLTVETARGASGNDPADIDKAGWFIVIKERPGEPRFGFDVPRDAGTPAATLNVFADVSWSDVQLNAAKFLQVGNAIPALTLVEPTGADSEKHPQWEDDRQVTWNNNMSAAEVAYVLFQQPVLVAIHASEMLPRPGVTP
jgi:hypothetical protein